MKNIEDSKLDNPVWHSLKETHHPFSVNYDNIKFYHPDYCPFGGFREGENKLNADENYSGISNQFFIVGEMPMLPNDLILQKDLVCLQMIIHDKIIMNKNEVIIKLTDQHKDKLFDLVNLVQPGYFRKKTSLLGEYFGIFKNDQLIAVTGERMKMNDFTEVSAIVTHPEYTGRGYAKQLVAHVVNNILQQNKTPYLHVVENNIGAIALYEKLGFETRRKISFWNIGQSRSEETERRAKA
ncbi:MAG: GNAT family N-acetyltransferase [Bacteroidetes bacterium]|nr:GNAT family N-acetyltransferase [Bacteroidota bacterium]